MNDLTRRTIATVQTRVTSVSLPPHLKAECRGACVKCVECVLVAGDVGVYMGLRGLVV